MRKMLGIICCVCVSCVTEEQCGRNEIFCGECVPVDRLHCGRCDMKCSGRCIYDSSARDYRCAPPCTENQAECGDRCVELDTRDHCGSCDNACDESERCLLRDGKYGCETCQWPNKVCENQCVAVNTAVNCGDCGIKCDNDQYCEKNAQTYRCVKAPLTCEWPYEACGERCVMTNTEDHCGGCDKSCSPTEKCVSYRDTYRCENLCANGVRDEGEDAVDCGGLCEACTSCAKKGPSVCLPLGKFCDSNAGYRCSVPCEPFNSVDNTPSKQCPEGICRADGRCSSPYFETIWEVGGEWERKFWCPGDVGFYDFFRDDDPLSIEFYFGENAKCDFTVDWGDGTSSIVDDCSSSKMRHGYQKAGRYHVKIKGVFEGWGYDSQDLRYIFDGDNEWATHCYLKEDVKKRVNRIVADSAKLKEIVSFGPVTFGEGTFAYMQVIMPSNDIPDASKLNSMRHLFLHAEPSDVSHWDVSGVKDMSYVFYGSTYTGRLDRWDVGNVLDMRYAFFFSKFDHPLGAWNVSKVKNMSHMFEFSRFDQEINGWNVSKVEDMSHMFSHSKFNRPLDKWDVSKVTNMSHMFTGTYFNRPLDEWNVSNVRDMSFMFYFAYAFNQPLDKWKVHNVETMESMFEESNYKQSIDDWNCKNVKTTKAMFASHSIACVYDNATQSYGQNVPLSMRRWKLPKVEDMSRMFEGRYCNPDIKTWTLPDTEVKAHEMFVFGCMEKRNFCPRTSFWKKYSEIYLGLFFTCD